METIEIALAANESYSSGLYVTACSIAAYCDKAYALRFNVLDSNITAASKQLVDDSVHSLHPNSTFRWMPVDEKIFAGLQKWNGGYMVYTRLLLPELLKDIDWCVYCDCDFTWMRDVSELWGMRDDDYAMLGTRDGARWTLDIEGKWFKEHGFAFNRDDYFCAGLTFFNLKKFRDDNIDEKCLELLRLHPPFNDQSVLNITCFGQVKLVPQIWQRFSERVTQAELDGGVVIHHAGQVPWTRMRWFQQLDDCRLIWHQHYAKYRCVSEWQSLRTFYSPASIIFHRTLVWLFRCRFLSCFMSLIARISGRLGAYDYQKMRSRRLLVRV